MRSVYEIAKSHMSLPVSKDMNALKRVLRDWLHYTEKLQLQEKVTHPAALCVTVHFSRQTTPPSSRPSSFFDFHRTTQNAAAGTYTRRVPLRLWTALLPWEVQRGLSMSELRLPSTPNASDGTDEVDKEHNEGVKGSDGMMHKEEEEDDADPFGVVTAPTPSTSTSPTDMNTKVRVSRVNTPAMSTAASLTGAFPGMLFVMDVDAAAQGVSFWSGAILQPIDVAFISPVEPTVTNSPSFKELRQRRLAAYEKGGGNLDEKQCVFNLSHFFPDGELDSPTVTFAVQSYSHLDPFPRCEKSSETRQQEQGQRQRQHMAQPYDVERNGRHDSTAGGDNNNNNNNNNNTPRYVLETLRYLLRESVEGTIKECRQMRGTTGKGMNGKDEDIMDVTISLELSDSLKEELREKARLYANYVMPLEKHIAYRIRRQSSGVAMESEEGNNNKDDTSPMRNETERNTKEENELVASAMNSSSSSSAPVVVTGGLIQPPQPNTAREGSLNSLRSPMIAEEYEDLPSHLAPSVKGKHEAPALQRAQREQNQLVSAKALARYPNTHSHMPPVPPVDYELFDLCLRLGLCQQDAIYYFYGRIMREWQKELQRLKKGGNSKGSEISDVDVRRMFQLVSDPSLQVPDELSACVMAVARRRDVMDEVRSL